MTKAKLKPQSHTTSKMIVGGKHRVASRASMPTKKSQLIRLLSKEGGADAASISKKFGWLPHTTRATLSGLRKAGYEISSMKAGTGKPTRYRIMGAPEEQSAH
jgi:predicted ArsR family transcriptional regulator